MAANVPLAGDPSEGASVFDPNPYYDDHLPVHVLSTLIDKIQETMEEELKAGEFIRAEQSQLRAIKLAEQRERDRYFQSVHRNRIRVSVEMRQKLATIYVYQRKFEPAKHILETLICVNEEEGKEGGFSPQRRELHYQLYHDLAKIHLEEGALEYARKFAMRAYKGRETLQPQGIYRASVLQSVDLLSRIYELQGDIEIAETFKKMLPANQPRNYVALWILGVVLMLLFSYSYYGS